MPVENTSGVPLKYSGPFITPEELSARWCGKITVRTLGNWRLSKCQRGPAWVRIGGVVLYPVKELEAYEVGNLVVPCGKEVRDVAA